MGVVLVSAFTEVKRRFTEVKRRFIEVEPRSTEVGGFLRTDYLRQ